MQDNLKSAELEQGDAANQTEGGSVQEAQEVPKWKIHRRLYDWVLSWSESRYSYPFLFVLAFIESSFFLIPPDALLLPLVLGKPRNWLRAATICTVGSVLGGVLGYAIGMFFMQSIGMEIIAFYHAEDYFTKVNTWYEQYDFWIVFIAAFSPIPYKVFTIASGAFSMNLLGFVLVSAIGRGGRFFLLSGLVYFFGPTVKEKIDKYFDILSIAAVLLLILGFAAISLL